MPGRRRKRRRTPKLWFVLELVHDERTDPSMYHSTEAWFVRDRLCPEPLTRTLQICRFFSPSFGGRMASAFSLVKSRSLYLVIGPMWQKFILLTIPHYSKIDWPLTLFCTRSPPFMSSDVIFLQAKWSKIKERVKGWKSGKKTWFKRITVCLVT